LNISLKEKLISVNVISISSTLKQLEDAKEESKRAAAETERLLQLVQMSQEEQNAKEKTIMDLQQYELLLKLYQRF
jgi:hypothetical protein